MPGFGREGRSFVLARQVAARISRLVPHCDVLFTTRLEHDGGMTDRPRELIGGQTFGNMLLNKLF
jgi:hypothetical protein